MLAYKFLGSGGVGPFSGYRWSTPGGGPPGEWVTPGGAPPPFDDGVHACRSDQLAYWVNDELWEIELAGDVLVYERHVLGARGRLLHRVEVLDA